MRQEPIAIGEVIGWLDLHQVHAHDDRTLFWSVFADLEAHCLEERAKKAEGQDG